MMGGNVKSGDEDVLVKDAEGEHCDNYNEREFLDKILWHGAIGRTVDIFQSSDLEGRCW